MGFMGVAGGMQAVDTYMSWKNQKENAKAQERALSAQANAVGKNMAYAFQNYEAQRMDAFDATVNNIMKVRVNSVGLESSVRAAINEETGGDSRTGRALQRATHADTLRTISGLKDSYERQSDEIDLNKEATRRSAMDEIANIKAQAPEMPSVWQLVGSLAGVALNSYNSYKNAQANAQASGMELDKWWRATNPTAGYTNRYHFSGVTDFANKFPMNEAYVYSSIGRNLMGSTRYRFDGMPTFTTGFPMNPYYTYSHRGGF